MSVASEIATSTGRPDDLAELLGELASLLERPAWQQYARCRGFGTDAFFRGRGEAPTVAKIICPLCPVREECREAGQGEVGVWGGLSEAGRRRMKREVA